MDSSRRGTRAAARRRRGGARRRAHGRRRADDSQLRGAARRGPWLRPASLLTLQMNVPDAYDTPAKRLAYYDTLFARLDALPGVQAVGGTRACRWAARTCTTSIMSRAKTSPRMRGPKVEIRRALHHYFPAMGIPVLEGRVFTRDDRPDAPPVAVINRVLATAPLRTRRARSDSASGLGNPLIVLADDHRCGRQRSSRRARGDAGAGGLHSRAAESAGRAVSGDPHRPAIRRRSATPCARRFAPSMRRRRS